ncbi:MAG: Bax inhibitor-1/YccA family protein [Candidatus Aenigmarchaeota archaeon]|nr:Bax inhibitor-1/YccA family protein [Candidatus Aenigmarchaeota archaeon]MCX8179588.1 Bax inhibitor-1/YccA family protein [Candidatus Aenigmarchaeota archaeon]
MKKEVFNKKVLPMFVLSLLIATLGVGVGFFIPPILYIPILIAEVAILIVTMILKKKEGFPTWLLFLFVFLTGITTTPIVAWAAWEGGIIIVFQALGITTVVFAILAGYVYFTNKDFRSIGTFLMFALIGFIIASIVNIFLKQSTLQLVINVGVLIVFLGFVLYDMSNILRNYPDKYVTDAVLALYLDFLNIFIRILSLLVESRKRE